MKKFTFLLLGILILIPILSNAQVFLDSLYKYPAEVYAYKVDTPPVIDGDLSDWENVPWSGTALFNDRDFNGDNILDPLPERLDFQGRFKSVWIDGSNVIYIMIERSDDLILSSDEISWYQVDGSEIRIDPFNEDQAGEPGSGNAFNIGFRVGKDTHNGIEGPLPTYEAKWNVNETVFPTKAVLELAVTLPTTTVLEELYTMGFHIYFSDTENDDDSPDSKSNCLQFWGQLYNSALSERLGVDATWANIHSWGDLVCVKMPTIHTVTGGGTGVIQAAIDAAADGDIIKVGSGTYYENLVISKPRIQLISTADMAAGDTTKIIPSVVSTTALTVSADNMTRNVVIQGFAFDGTYMDVDTVKWSQQSVEIFAPETKFLNNVVYNFNAAVSSSADYVVLEGNTIYNSNDGGIKMNGYGSCIVRYNKIDDIFGGYGIDHKGLKKGELGDIAFNEISDVRQCGIGWGGNGGTFYLHHNYIYRSFDERTTGAREMDDGIENQESTASISYVYNNTIVGWNSDGMQLNGPSKFYLRNNLVAQQKADRDYDIRNPLTVVYDIGYGLSWNTNKDHMKITDLDAVNSLNADPLFTDELSDDYSLTAASPAKDKGQFEPFGFKTHYAIPAGGYNGTDACRPDIGAYEVNYGVTAIGNDNPAVAKRFDLSQNYPNPFNPTTTIRFNLANTNHVKLNVYDINGREIVTLVNNLQLAGEHLVEWNAAQYSSGIYFYTLHTNGKTVTRKMALIK
jgi:hypothetical protein